MNYKTITKQIKLKLFGRDMKQTELSNLISEGSVQGNRAIHGDMSSKSKEIREKIYKVLEM
ncbi:transcriptional regulator [Pediococcus ethanolidurans]|nr:transcriptional regulator [Pediococcus ethanolidurans]